MTIIFDSAPQRANNNKYPSAVDNTKEQSVNKPEKEKNIASKKPVNIVVKESPNNEELAPEINTLPMKTNLSDKREVMKEAATNVDITRVTDNMSRSYSK